jgi:hypothetical protein
MTVTRFLAIGLGIHLVAATACSDMTSGNRSPTAATPIQMSERRVGDSGGDTPPDCAVGSPCIERPLIPRWEIVAADGDVLGFVCDTAVSCNLRATGRFEGVSFTESLVDGRSYPTSFLVQDGSIQVVLSIRLQDGQNILTIATLDARTTIVPDLSCESDLRASTTFGGAMPHLGRVTGTYSVCVKPQATSAAPTPTD